MRLFLAAALILSGCVPEDDSFFTKSFHNVSTVTVPANLPYIKNVSDGALVPIGLLGESEAKDIKSVTLLATFVPNGAAVDPAMQEHLTEIKTYPDTVVISESDLLELAGLPNTDGLNAGDRWIITYKVTQADGEELTNRVKTNITFTCESDLAGEYTFSTTDIVSGDGTDVSGCGVAATGSGELIETSGGVYTFTDNTFGLFDCAYGPAPTQGNLTISHLCGKITWEGEDHYGDTYSMNIINNTGVALTFEWHNTYGDGGTTTLTRTDGKTWPADLYTE